MKYLNSGTAVTSFSVAANRQYKAQSGEQVKETMWVRVSAFGKLAEVCSQYLAKGKQVYIDMISAMTKGAASLEVQACIERWRKYMDYFWTPNLDQLVGLTEGYVNDPRFRANFDAMHPQLAEFLLEAVKVYAAGKR